MKLDIKQKTISNGDNTTTTLVREGNKIRVYRGSEKGYQQVDAKTFDSVGAAKRAMNVGSIN